MRLQCLLVWLCLEKEVLNKIYLVLLISRKELLGSSWLRWLDDVKRDSWRGVHISWYVHKTKIFWKEAIDCNLDSRSCQSKQVKLILCLLLQWKNCILFSKLILFADVTSNTDPAIMGQQLNHYLCSIGKGFVVEC